MALAGFKIPENLNMMRLKAAIKCYLASYGILYYIRSMGAKISEQPSLSFDDVLLTPEKSSVLPSQVQLKTSLGPLTLGIPVLSAAMDTVTEADTAIALSLMGGLGVLHKNMSARSQASEVKKVKRFQYAVIPNPITVREGESIRDLKTKVEETGVTGFPVINEQGVLVGMCTGRDIRYCEDETLQVSQVMSAPVKSLAQGASPEDAKSFFMKNKIEKLPLLDEQGRLVGLMTSKDLRRAADHPSALRDQEGRLVVAAAIGVGSQDLNDRAEQLVAEGVDCLVVDSSHGHSEGGLKAVEFLRQRYPELILMGGNIATAQAAKDLIAAGVNIVKIGIGPGSICTTRMVSGVGFPQLSAIMDVAAYTRQHHPEVGIVADGGIRYSGDITKALAAGAHAVMLGSLLAGTDESPGETILYQGRSYKSYRGMGSLAAMKKGRGDRYFQGGIQSVSKLVPEGVEARVPYRGPLSQVIFQLLGGLRSGMGLVGAESIAHLYEKGRFIQISSGGLSESHVHDVTITAEAPNYSGRKH